MTVARLPKGADLLADVRRQGARPGYPVFVFIDANRPRPRIWSDMPIQFEVCVKPFDCIDDLTFWPLADLDVHVHAPKRNDRMRAVLRAIVQARPGFVIGAVPSEGAFFTWSSTCGWQFETVEKEVAYA